MTTSSHNRIKLAVIVQGRDQPVCLTVVLASLHLRMWKKYFWVLFCVSVSHTHGGFYACRFKDQLNVTQMLSFLLFISVLHSFQCSQQYLLSLKMSIRILISMLIASCQVDSDESFEELESALLSIHILSQNQALISRFSFRAPFPSLSLQVCACVHVCLLRQQVCVLVASSQS